VFDTETTGLRSEDKVIQFSGAKYQVGQDYSLTKVSELGLYINPGMPLPPKITEITGITDDMLRDFPNEYVLGSRIFNYLEDADVLAAYNANFDLRMLRGMAERVSWFWDETPTVDVLEMARDWCPSGSVANHKLATVAEYLLPNDLSGFHNADVDVAVTAMVMEVCLKKYAEAKPAQKGYAIHLESAHLFENPYQKSQKRIRLKLSEGDAGSIYYDIVNKVWACKSDAKSKKLFESVDMSNLEEQFLSKYGYRYGLTTMDEVAKSWQQFAREKKRERNA
jgi:DNA polymerase III alpha subunit (gram-positive type)